MRTDRLALTVMAMALLVLAGSSQTSTAQRPSLNDPSSFPHSMIPGLTQKIGLWDKPNQACITKCEIFVSKGCFKELSDKFPAADAGSLQEKCDDKFSLCLYDCMCDTCDENQIIIKQP